MIVPSFGPARERVEGAACSLARRRRQARDRREEWMQTRREVLIAGMAGLFASGRSAQPRGAASALPAALGADDGERVYVGRDPVRIKLSQEAPGRLAMITQEVSPGTTIPVHLHEREDEIIFIQSGEGEATLGERRVALAAGSMLFVPQGTWHGGRNTGRDVLMWIAIYSPSGFQGYFREIGRRSVDDPPRMLSPEAREARDRRYGIRYP
jgi:mannose-6-phosphate isomerase-like protein (cupin superfamily)